MYVMGMPTPASVDPPAEPEEHITGEEDTAPIAMLDLDYSRKVVGTRGTNQYTDEVASRQFLKNPLFYNEHGLFIVPSRCMKEKPDLDVRTG